MTEHGRLEGVFKQGYGLVPKLIMRDRDLTPEAKAIYCYLASFTGAGKTAYPSVSLMSSELNMGVDRFYRHRKQLIEKDYIRISRRKNEGEWSNNVYTLTSIPYPQNADTENEDTQNKDTQNEGTINNSTIINSIKSNNSNSPARAERIPYKKIIGYLNEQAGRQFNHKAQGNQDLIKARWNEGYNLEDFKKAIDNKVAHAKDPKHFFGEEYLRPSTLFRKSNFDEYVNAFVSKKEKKADNEMDFEELQKMLNGG